MNDIEHFTAKPQQYVFFFGDIGPVKIDSAIIDGSKLSISYTYFDSGEHRTGVTVGKLEGVHFSGRWETRADNGNNYSGCNQFDFSSDGSAIGSWGMRNADKGSRLLIKKKAV